MAGVALANLMYQLPPWHPSNHLRSGPGVWLGEAVATAGLLLVIGSLTRTGRSHLSGVLVPLWIGAAYFFTASTSFANPAVTLARAASDTFAGIAPGSVPGFVLAQLLGAGVGAVLGTAVFPAAQALGRPALTELADPHDPILERS
jgi:arsenate reductase